MKKIKQLITILFLAAALFLAGCEEDSAPTGPSPYIGGSKGIMAEFEPLGVEEGGIYKIFEGETFPIQIVLKNKGEHDVSPNDVKIQVYGILIDDYDGISTNTLSNTKKIEKISELNDEEGGEEIVNFGQDVTYRPSVGTTFYDANIFASYTYRYKSFGVVPKVCFKENIRDDRVCDVDETKKVFSSGAPIQVNSAREKPAGAGLIEVTFKVENVGGGRVTIPGKEFSVQFDQLAYAIEPASEAADWGCTAAGRENEARLVDGKATIRCRLKTALPENALYTKQLSLTLHYDYRDIIQETVRILKII